MSDKTTIFSSASILLPDYLPDSAEYKKWSVIACDQFTSDISYWDKCEKLIGSSPSAYDYILPEAFLGTDREKSKNLKIENSIRSLANFPFKEYADGYIYVERTLKNDTIRRGIVGKIDLESYDYTHNSMSKIRATEATVLERVPPRCAVRAKSPIEFPHIIIFISDKRGIFSAAQDAAEASDTVYDFDLMQDGGHIKGFYLGGKNASALTEIIYYYEQSAPVVYAIGDGNHSLAAAKLHYENIKSEIGSAAVNHPARYALCEIVAIEDSSICFEPIYRILKNCNPENVLEELKKISSPGETGQSLKMIYGGREYECSFNIPTHELTVGSLQNFIDSYINDNPETVCDYIHGKSELAELSRQEGSVGFLFDGISKNDLFTFVQAHGTYPRKTFSMGDSRSKRYYLEARKIIQ